MWRSEARVKRALILFAFSCAGLSSCGSDPFFRNLPQRSLSSDSSGDGWSPIDPGSYRRCDRLTATQPTGNRLSSVDLLFVSDTSGSLDAERGALARSIGDFVSRLPADVDYRVAVMLGHGSLSGWSGRLYASGSNPKVLDSSTRSLGEIQTILQDTLTHPVSDGTSDGGEEMIFSLNRAFDSDRLAESQALGFFRNSAALSVLLVSDENDICRPADSYGTFPHFVRDGDNQEGPSYTRDCVRPNGQDYLQYSRDRLRTARADAPFLVNGLVYTDPATIPREGENAIGHGILEFVSELGGTSLDLANPSFASSLAKIGELTSLRLTLRTEFDLPGTGIAPESIHALIDGNEVAVSFDLARSRITIPITAAGGAGSKIEISYCQL